MNRDGIGVLPEREESVMDHVVRLRRGLLHSELRVEVLLRNLGAKHNLFLGFGNS